MQANDARTVLHAAVPTAAVGAIAAAVCAFVAGGKGAIGAAVGALVVILAMGSGLVVLLRTARSLPHLFQAMGLMLFAAEVLLLFIFLATFKDTTLFNSRAFAAGVVAGTLTWVIAQARAQMKAKIFYVDPQPSGSQPSDPKPGEPGPAGGKEPEKSGRST
jgi:ATP synthase protein I